MEVQNIKKLQSILDQYSLTIKNAGPILIPRSDFEKIDSLFEFTRIEEKDFCKFKGKVEYAFSFDDGIWKDRLALAFYYNEKLVAIAGANQNSKFCGK